MRLKIIGSGGCVSTPKPCCTCRVCKEAREKGFPYARSGCSLFVEDEKILFDTPEDICYGLNNAEVDDVQMVLYSHSDPDHTMGMRVFEQLRLNWMEVSVGNTCGNPFPKEKKLISYIFILLKKGGSAYRPALCPIYAYTVRNRKEGN